MKYRKYLVAALAGFLGVAAHGALADDAGSAPAASDAAITEAVKGKLSVDDPQIARYLQVETKDGVVTLRGVAFTPTAALKALKDAGSVRGVAKVQNHIVVQQ